MNAGGMPKTCKSNETTFGRPKCLHETESGFPSSGRRVSNTWVTYLFVGDNSWKRLLIPNVLYGVKKPLKLR